MIPNIVTCFFDIGRSDWVGPTLPHYIKRTTAEYFTNFERLLKLENRIIVFTSPDLVSRFDQYKQHKYLDVIGIDYKTIYPNTYEDIRRIQQLPEFKADIQQPYNPEYWSPDYVMVNLLKSFFVDYAAEHGLIDTDMVAWVDFGYARRDEDVPTSLWECDFNEDRIHVFTHKDSIPERIDVANIIERNEVYLMGCHIVASPSLWFALKLAMFDNMRLLLKNNMVDDDQTLLLMSYIQNKDFFEIHYTNQDYWFCLFTKYNKDVK